MNKARISSSTLSAWRLGSGAFSARHDFERPLAENAKTAWSEMGCEFSTFESCVPGPEEVPDFAYAFRNLILADHCASADAVCRIFNLLSDLEWEETLFAERQDVLADIAYEISVKWRREKNYPKMRHWEELCISLLAQTEPSATYLANRCANGPIRADKLFLVRPAVLLAVCHQLEQDRNRRPREAKAQAISALRAIEGSSFEPEQLSYFRGYLAHCLAVSECHLGNFASSAEWLGTARVHFSRTSFPAALLVGLSAAELIWKHARHYWKEVLEELGEVLCSARELGISRQVVSLRLLRAHALKDLGRFEEAFLEFRQLDVDRLTDDPVMLANNLVGLAETQHALGDPDGAADSCRRASAFAQRSGAALSWGMVHASIGQILRDSGRPSEALEELERSIAAYASGGMAQLESYMMMVTAELLLGLGRWHEGISRLLGAIAILKRTKVDKEIVAAVELLRAAVNSGLSPSAQATLELRQILGRLER